MRKLKKLIKRGLENLLFKKYYVFGDSHTEVFKYISDNRLIRFKRFIVTSVGGATATGMRNPNSKTNSLNLFNQKISILNKNTNLIFQLGEVDTGFVIWYRSQKYNESVDSQLQNSITSYVDFIKKIKREGFNNISIISAPLPTILDNQDWGDVANLRKAIKATLRERTDLTLKYNKILSQKVVELGCKFIDTDRYLLNKETGIIYNSFRNSDKNNHHLDLNEYSKVVVNAIKNEKI